MAMLGDLMFNPFDSLDPGWQSRTKWKLTATAMITAVAASVSNRRKVLPLYPDVPHKIMGYSMGMGIFCAVQEGLRAARGTHDVLNTALAGAVAGNLLSRAYQGPRHHRLATVAWGSVAALCHALDALLRPGQVVENVLIHGGLLDPRVAERRPGYVPPSVDEVYRSARASGRQGGRGSAAFSRTLGVSDSLMIDAARIRQREMADLAAAGWEQAAGAGRSGNATGLGGGLQGEGVAAGAASDAAGRDGGKGSGGWWRWESHGRQADPAVSNSTSVSGGYDGPQSVGGGSGVVAGVGRRGGGNATGLVKSKEGLGAPEMSVRSVNHDDDEADDEEDYQRWLAGAVVSQEGLVIPSGASDKDLQSLRQGEGKTGRRGWWGWGPRQ